MLKMINMNRAIPALALAVGAAACSRSTTVESAGDIGSVAPAASPRNARNLPAGTDLRVRLDQQIGTNSSRVGDEFTATVTQDVVAQNGRVAVPAGSTIYGHITGLHTSQQSGDPAAIRVDFDRIAVNGENYPFTARVSATNLKMERSNNDAIQKAGIGAAAGAVLGAIIGEGDLKKILIGGAIGAAAGTVISLGTGDVQGVLPAGTEMTLQSTQAVALRR